MPLVAVMLLSCERPVTRSDAHDIAEDMADTHTQQLAARIEELESKVEDLEQKLERLDDREDKLTDAVIKDLDSVNDRVTRFQSIYDQHRH